MVTVCVEANTTVNLFNSAGPYESQCQGLGFHFPLFVFSRRLAPAQDTDPSMCWRPSGADRTFSDQYLGQVRAGEQMKEEGTEPGTASSGLLITLVANRTPRMVHCA